MDCLLQYRYQFTPFKQEIDYDLLYKQKWSAFPTIGALPPVTKTVAARAMQIIENHYIIHIEINTDLSSPLICAKCCPSQRTGIYKVAIQFTNGKKIFGCTCAVG